MIMNPGQKAVQKESSVYENENEMSRSPPSENGEVQQRAIAITHSQIDGVKDLVMDTQIDVHRDGQLDCRIDAQQDVDRDAQKESQQEGQLDGLLDVHRDAQQEGQKDAVKDAQNDVQQDRQQDRQQDGQKELQQEVQQQQDAQIDANSGVQQEMPTQTDTEQLLPFEGLAQLHIPRTARIHMLSHTTSPSPDLVEIPMIQRAASTRPLIQPSDD